MKFAFKSLEIGAIFHSNGNLWQKKSTRTAIILGLSRVFYFKKNELCMVEV